METLLWGIVIGIIGGIASLSFNHPNLANKIIYLLMGVSVIIYLSTLAYNLGKVEAFNKSIEPVQNTKGYKALSPLGTIGDIRSQRQIDSVNRSWVDNKDLIVLDARANGFEDQLKSNIVAEILGYAKNVRHNNIKLLEYLFVSLGILVGLRLLSFFFDSFHKRSNSPTNRAKKSPPKK